MVVKKTWLMLFVLSILVPEFYTFCMGSEVSTPSCDTYKQAHEYVVNCSHRGLTRFPNFDSFAPPTKLFLPNNNIRKFPNEGGFDFSSLEELDLENNSLETLANFNFLPNLKVLNLRNNQLTSFSLSVQILCTDRQYPEQVTLSGNPWLCDYPSNEYKTLLQKYGNRVTDFGKLKCKLSNSSDDYVYIVNDTCDRFLSSERKPSLMSAVVIASLGIIFGVLAFVIVSIIFCVVYRHLPYIKLWLFTRGFCLQTSGNDDGDKFDSFVAYSFQDEKWVMHHLVKGLEAHIPACRLGTGSRDNQPKALIWDAICDSLKKSRSTIIVLTDNFIKNEWCRLELNLACQQMLSDHTYRVIIVVPGKKPDMKASPNSRRLRNLLYMKHIFLEDADFWKKLQFAMPNIALRMLKIQSKKELKSSEFTKQETV